MNDKFRMYGLVPYNISPIQQAIQYGHALQEYNNNIFDNERIEKDSPTRLNFNTWRKECKTFIILNGGTTNNSEEEPGTLNEHLEELYNMNWINESFYEPHLGNQLTAVVFLVPEQVYNRKLYPDFWDWEPAKEKFEQQDLRKMKNDPTLKNFTGVMEEYRTKILAMYFEWVTFLGGNENVVMRNWLSQFRLA